MVIDSQEVVYPAKKTMAIHTVFLYISLILQEIKG